MHLDAMGIMNQPVENAIRQRGIADLFVPPRHGKLRSEDLRAHLVAILADLPKGRGISGSDSGAMTQSSITSTDVTNRPTYCAARRLPS